MPGVTVPLSDIPFILVSLFCSQIIHELGHAVAAAVYGLAIQAAGLSVTVCLPTAFVVFSSHTLPPLTNARIAAAGPFHNLLCWLLAASLLRAVEWAAYVDSNSWGKVIIRVQPVSVLVCCPRSI